MHELAIAEQIRDVVIDAAEAYPEKRVTAVTLRVGQLRAIHPDTMDTCWEAVTRDSRVAGSGLIIDEVTATGCCQECGCVFETEDLVFVCPECGGIDVSTLSGKELVVDGINLE